MSETESHDGQRAQRLRFATARDVFDAFPTLAGDVTAAPTDEAPADYAKRLMSTPTPEDALTFTAYLLPRREGVWWGHQCLNVLPEALNEFDFYCLNLAEAWVRSPDEETRNAALTAGYYARSKTPGTWVALAAGWSGGFMLPPGEPEVPAQPQFTAKALNSGILSVLARVDRQDRAPTLQRFVGMGFQLLTY